MKIPQKFGWFLKFIVTTVSLWFIYREITTTNWQFGGIIWNVKIYVIIFIVCILMGLNWLLEALRWKVSLENFEQIHLKEAIKTILMGLSLNWVLPFTTGDFAVRLFSLKNKKQATSAVVFNRILISFFTLLYGIYVLLNYSKAYNFNKKWVILIAVLVVIAVIIIWIFKNKITPFLAYFRQLSARLILRISLITLLRFLLFTVQLVCLIAVFNENLEITTILVGVGWIFMARTILPALIGGIGVRETAGMLFFSQYVENASLVLLPISLVWVINIVIPSLVGVWLLWRRNSLRI